MKQVESLNFVKIPKELIYSNRMTEKRVMIYSYLVMNRVITSTKVNFSIEDICNYIGYKPTSITRRISKDVVDTIYELVDYDYLYFRKDTSIAGIKYCNSLYINDSKQYKTIYAKYFGILFVKEIEQICSSEKIKNKFATILLLSYIRSNYSNKKNQPTACIKYLKDIEKDIGLSYYQVKQALSNLVDLGFIYTKELVNEKIDSIAYRAGKIIFADTEKDAKWLLALTLKKKTEN